MKLHHIDYDPNMSLWADFKQNQRPKIFSEKIAIFTRRVRTCRECQNPKNLIMGFLSNKQPEECKTSSHVNMAQTWVCETISVKIEDKKFLVKNSDFP